MMDPQKTDIVGATGTWTLVNDVISITIPISSTNLTATYNPKVGKLTGTWGTTPSNTNGGTWEMTKQ